MAEFNDTYHKAGVLMRSALKKYEEGNFEAGDKDREEANRLYDLAEREVSSDQGTAILYDTKKLFHKNPYGIKKIYKLIKENKVLKAEFDIYNALVYPDSVEDTNQYVNEALSIIPKFTKEQLIRNNQKFINAIRKLGLNEMVTISDEDMNLFESIEYIMLNGKKLSNINEYVDAKKCISEHIENKCSTKIDESKTIDDVLGEGIEKMNENYESNLNNDEKILVEKLSSLENKESYFDMAKIDTLKILNNSMELCEGEDKEKLTQIVENISNKNYDDVHFIYDAAEFREIKNTLLKENVMDSDKVQSLASELSKCYNGSVSRNEDYIKGELSYYTPDTVDASLIFDDIKKMTDKYSSEDLGYMVVNNINTGKYNGWWAE